MSRLRFLFLEKASPETGRPLFRSGLSLSKFIGELENEKNPYSSKPNVAASHINGLFRGDVKARVSDDLRETLREVVRRKISEPNALREWLGELDRACASLRRFGDTVRSQPREILQPLFEAALEMWVLWPRSASVGSDIVSEFSARVFDLDADQIPLPKTAWMTPDQQSGLGVRMAIMKPIAVASPALRPALEERWVTCESEQRIQFSAIPGALCDLPLIISDPRSWGTTRAFLVLPDPDAGSSQLVELPQLLVAAWRSESLTQVLSHLDSVYSGAG